MEPVILFFLLGLGAGLGRSELRLPAAVYELLATVLLLAIGLKGGVELASQGAFQLVPHVLGALVFATALPPVAFPLLRYLGRLSRADAAGVAAHYGSVSVGTFAVATAFLANRGVAFEAHMTLLVVVMEVPAILVGILLARGLPARHALLPAARSTLLSKGVVLLVGGLLIGWLAGPDGVAPLAPLFFDLFRGILALFLLEMGLITASHSADLRRHGVFLLGFGILWPLVAATLGVLAGWGLGLSVGGTAMFATLAASASYIAAPAALRVSLPEANPALSLAAALGVTFPFNIVLGIPLYLKMAQWVAGPGGG